ncbi:MAG: TfoX/Sxy family protein [Pirellulaceae bacterium]
MTETDEELIKRIRPFVKRRKGYSEKRMFGGLCFFINGNMTVGPWKGSLIVRLAKEDHDANQRLPHATSMDITGKVMKGWVKVEPAAWSICESNSASANFLNSSVAAWMLISSFCDARTGCLLEPVLTNFALDFCAAIRMPSGHFSGSLCCMCTAPRLFNGKFSGVSPTGFNCTTNCTKASVAGPSI